MRTFDGNLNAYHALNKSQELQQGEFTQRFSQATTPEEGKKLLNEWWLYIGMQRKAYKELGDEMAKIISKKWWQFWK